jgi:hypothetical protein
MNFGALFKAFDLLLLAGTAARRIAGRSSPGAELESVSGSGGRLESRLAGVVVAALKEAFNRDHARLELEREHLEAERRRAEEAQRLELRRQAIDREVARLRLLAMVALVGWIASVGLLAVRLDTMTPWARGAVSAGWFLLLAALASAFSAQGRAGSDPTGEDSAIESGSVGVASLWLLVSGLALSALSLLL